MAELAASAGITAEPARVDPSKIIYPAAAPLITPAEARVTVPLAPRAPGKRGLILNIETDGLKPWENRIIAIGIQDPAFPNDMPTIIMDESEEFMIYSLLMVIKEGRYNELIGYGLSFDYRFLLMKYMKYNLDCKEFYDCDLYDLGQAMAQGKFEYVYYAQKQPKLSDIADFFWGYPKPFTDLEMIEYYKLGQLDKVVEFATSQIIRINALYVLFRRIIETSALPLASGIVGFNSKEILPPTQSPVSPLTIPEAHLPEMITLVCKNCLGEIEVTKENIIEICPVCGAKLTRKL